MAKKLKAESSPAPDHLTMTLFAPGMTVLHRAGLGGLVSTLRYVEQAYETGALDTSTIPGAPWPNPQTPPWVITGQSVKLLFGKEANAAGEYFNRLCDIAFGVVDGLIFFPGQYGGLPPSLPVRAALQDGLLRTFYDHGPQSRGLGQRVQITYEVDNRQFMVEYPRIEWYSHRSEAARLATASLRGPQPLTRMLYPGAIQRHVKHAASSITNPAALLVPLLFAPVGCFALRAGGKRVKDGARRVFKPGGVIVMPDFQDLAEAPSLLAAFIPREVLQTRVVSPGDAALGAEIRLRSANLLSGSGLAGVRAVWCCPTSWNTRLQPPSRVFEMDQRLLKDETLSLYACAMATLRPRILTNSEGQPVWIDSMARPLVADNLALAHPWYQDFVHLMTAADEFGRPIRNSLQYEQRGLHEMTTNPGSLTDRESILVRAVHQAIRNNLGRIRQDTDGDRPLSQATINRWKRFRERLRLSFVGAKTADQCRNALCTLFGNAGVIEELQHGWYTLLPMLSDQRWQLVRDLGLLALASYSGADEGVEDEEGNDQSETESEQKN